MIEFDADHPAAVLDAMRDVATRDARGWINLQPAVDPDDVPSQGGVFRIFSARGPQVPLCTWTPPAAGRRAPPVTSIGVQHGAGARILPLLAEAGIEVPGRWRVLQDQPKKGLVIAVPAEDDHTEVLVWLVAAGEACCPTRHHGWVAAVHRPRR